ncbi:hypothetical protein [Roseicella aquatilis]|uniref:Uncharacterized protein n=1 Tax=Roseicella aquatilis TaxID=2527868 RepID=A0A4R4DR57_9PROT|nr:hypothetical protein [Roseicella aquatilis]TCZ63525.1 hypothetical protein EXY23_09010 [Roseicella aquatilis]
MRQVKASACGASQMITMLRVSLPWIVAAHEAWAQAMGGDPWPCGSVRNREDVAAMIRFAVAGALAVQETSPESAPRPGRPHGPR